MRSLNWQDAAAMSISMVAALYLVRKLTGTLTPAGKGCSRGCSSCPASASTVGEVNTEPPLMQIGIASGIAIQKNPDSQAVNRSR